MVEESKIVSWATYLTPKEAVRAAKELLGGRLDPAQIKRSTGPRRSGEAGRSRFRQLAGPDEPIEAPSRSRPRSDRDPSVESRSERPRTKVLTKSEEQKRAARARAKLRKRTSSQTA